MLCAHTAWTAGPHRCRPQHAHRAHSVHSWTWPMPGATVPVTPPNTSITVVTLRVTLFQCCTLFSCMMFASWAAGQREATKKIGKAGAQCRHHAPQDGRREEARRGLSKWCSETAATQEACAACPALAQCVKRQDCRVPQGRHGSPAAALSMPFEYAFKAVLPLRSVSPRPLNSPCPGRPAFSCACQCGSVARACSSERTRREPTL